MMIAQAGIAAKEPTYRHDIQGSELLAGAVPGYPTGSPERPGKQIAAGLAEM